MAWQREITVSPAYGRDYTSAGDAIADWTANKYFRTEGLTSGTYINMADAKQYGVCTVRIRYNHKRRVTTWVSDKP